MFVHFILSVFVSGFWTCVFWSWVCCNSFFYILDFVVFFHQKQFLKIGSLNLMLCLFHLQALNKKEHRGCDSPDADSSYVLTPNTEEKYKKINEEFDNMMKSHKIVSCIVDNCTVILHMKTVTPIPNVQLNCQIKALFYNVFSVSKDSNPLDFPSHICSAGTGTKSCPALLFLWHPPYWLWNHIVWDFSSLHFCFCGPTCVAQSVSWWSHALLRYLFRQTRTEEHNRANKKTKIIIDIVFWFSSISICHFLSSPQAFHSRTSCMLHQAVCRTAPVQEEEERHHKL